MFKTSADLEMAGNTGHECRDLGTGFFFSFICEMACYIGKKSSK